MVHMMFCCNDLEYNNKSGITWVLIPDDFRHERYRNPIATLYERYLK